jgi:phage terminase small subunit
MKRLTSAPPPPPPYPDPPAHLSERSATLWRTIGPDRAVPIERRTLFEQALAALDRSDAAREAIGREGMTSVTASSGTVHIHPLCRVEREARAQFASIWCSLGLDRPASHPLDLLLGGGR